MYDQLSCLIRAEFAFSPRILILERALMLYTVFGRRSLNRIKGIE
jgi:hypothetical protein